MVLSHLRTDCDHSDAGEWALGVDATVIRAHHHAAGARHEPPKDIPADVLASVVLEAPIRSLKDTGGTRTTRNPAISRGWCLTGKVWVAAAAV